MVEVAVVLLAVIVVVIVYRISADYHLQESALFDVEVVVHRSFRIHL